MIGRCGKCGGGLNERYRCPVCRNKYNRELHRRRHQSRQRSTTRSARNSGRQVRKLADWYVRGLLSHGTSVQPSAWPADLVELKRVRLSVKRAIWQCQN